MRPSQVAEGASLDKASHPWARKIRGGGCAPRALPGVATQVHGGTQAVPLQQFRKTHTYNHHNGHHRERGECQIPASRFEQGSPTARSALHTSHTYKSANTCSVRWASAIHRKQRIYACTYVSTQTTSCHTHHTHQVIRLAGKLLRASMVALPLMFLSLCASSQTSSSQPTHFASFGACLRSMS
jgi:hypothetical protein